MYNLMWQDYKRHDYEKDNRLNVWIRVFYKIETLFIPLAAKLMQTIYKDLFLTSQRIQFVLSRKTN